MAKPTLKPGQAIAVTLSGGGTRLYGHAGVLKAIVESGLVVKEITGVSGGALVGAAFTALGVDGMQQILRDFDFGQLMRFNWLRGMGLYTNEAIAEACRNNGVTWERVLASGIDFKIGVTALEPSLGLVWGARSHPSLLLLAEAVRMSAAIPFIWGYTRMDSSRIQWDGLPAGARLPPLVTLVDGGASRMLVPVTDLPWIASDVATNGFPWPNAASLVDYVNQLLGSLQYNAMEEVLADASVAVRHTTMRPLGWVQRLTPTEIDAVIEAARLETLAALAVAMAP